MRKSIKLAALLAAVMGLSACVTDRPYLFLTEGEKAEMTADAEAKRRATMGDDYYEVYSDGRIYVFDDFKTYKSQLAHGEVAYRMMRIGEGPQGETVVFGLAAADKKKREGIASVEMFDGKLQGAEENFYGEIMYEDRFYVFSEWADLQAFKQTFDAPYRFTKIGEGPGGRTIVFVLNKNNKKKAPTNLVARYNAKHGQ